MAKKTAFYGLLVALAFIFGYIEFLLPMPFGVPGMKLGLANLILLLTLYIVGPRAAITVSVIRILLNGFTFGSVYGMLYSFAGALLSFIGMTLTYKRPSFSPIGVSVLGGILHNIGQLLVAFLFLSVGGLLYYIPVLLLSGGVTGMLIGFATAALKPKLETVWRRRI